MEEPSVHFSPVRLAVVTGLGGTLISLTAAVVGVAADSATAGIVVRVVLVTALLVVAVRAAREGGLSRPLVLAALAAGYALNLAWWGGSAYAARLLVDSAAAAALADLALWSGVGATVAMLAGPTPDRRSRRAR